MSGRSAGRPRRAHRERRRRRKPRRGVRHRNTRPRREATALEAGSRAAHNRRLGMSRSAEQLPRQGVGNSRAQALQHDPVPELVRADDVDRRRRSRHWTAGAIRHGTGRRRTATEGRGVARHPGGRGRVAGRSAAQPPRRSRLPAGCAARRTAPTSSCAVGTGSGVFNECCASWRMGRGSFGRRREGQPCEGHGHDNHDPEHRQLQRPRARPATA